MIIFIDEIKFEPPTYKLIWGTETKGWWIFKRSIEVGWIECSAGLRLGPFYNKDTAIRCLHNLKELQ